jgi:YaiO family outer membrane protein
MDIFTSTRPGKAADFRRRTVVKRRAAISRSAFFLALQLSFTTALVAQQTTVELVGGAQSLTGGYGDGGSIGIRFRHDRARDVWYAGVHRESRFDDTGFLGSIANTHVLDADWYSYLGIAASTDAIFLPQFRIDAQLARKLGAARQWVTTVSAAAAAAHDEHRDYGAGVGLIRYFASGLVVDGSVFFNRSTPGDVIARRQHLAITYLRPRRYQLSARASYGEEGYQITGAAATLVDFSSGDISVRWQQWLTSGTGISAAAEYYTNPFYSRTGFTVSLFKQFGP